MASRRVNRFTPRTQTVSPIMEFGIKASVRPRPMSMEAPSSCRLRHLQSPISQNCRPGHLSEIPKSKIKASEIKNLYNFRLLLVEEKNMIIRLESKMNMVVVRSPFEMVHGGTWHSETAILQDAGNPNI